MKEDRDLVRNVLQAISEDALLSSSEFGICPDNEVVSSFAKKSSAGNVTEKAAGIKVALGNIEVKLDTDNDKQDKDLAQKVFDNLDTIQDVTLEKINVEVRNGSVILEGEALFHYQREAIKKSVRKIGGISILMFNIRIKSKTHDEIEKRGIELALAHALVINPEDIHVTVSNDEVRLTGVVHSIYQKDEAEKIAWKARGVCRVDNRLVIE